MIRVIENGELYDLLEKEELPTIDLVISNSFGRLIKKPLLDWVNGNCINFHGAILPDYKGLFAYNHGILNMETEWGVTVHYVNERFDEGDIIKIRKFTICPEQITVKELEEQTQKVAYKLALEVIDQWKDGPLQGRKQPSGGKYYNSEDFENIKRVDVNDSAELVKRKIRACWCPPYEGAYVEIGGCRFQLLLERGRDL